MKSRKIILPIICTTGLAGTIAPVLSSCGCNTKQEETIKYIPDSLFSITKTNELEGFIDGADYSAYNALKIPASVNTIKSGAFKGKFTKESKIHTIILSDETRLIKANAFEDCDGITSLDLSQMTEESINYLVIESPIFGENANSWYCNIVYPANISKTSKTVLTQKLIQAGIPESWTKEKSTDKAEPVKEKMEQKADNGCAANPIKLNTQIKQTQTIKAYPEKVNSSDGVDVKFNDVQVVGTQVNVQSQMVEVGSHKFTDGDYVSYKITLVCVSTSENSTETTDWVQTLETFKLTYQAEPEKKYLVTFVSNGGSEVPSQEVKFNETIVEPTITRKGYKFHGWYTDESFGTKWNFATPVTRDLTLYAKWELIEFTVTFDSKGGTPVESQIIVYGEKLTEPTPPTKSSSTFDGWYTDDSYQTKWDFNNPVTAELHLVAKWNVITYTITFDAGEGTPIESQKVEIGQKALKPTDPVYEGHTLEGWYTEPEFVNKYDFDKLVKKSFTLYAKYTTNVYKVSFNTNGAGTIQPQDIIYKGKVTKPADPTLVGHNFICWCSDSSCTTEYDFTTEVKSSFTLYAKFDAIKYTVTFDSNGGSDVQSQQVAYNKKASKPTNPTKEGNDFVYWSNKTDLSTQYDFSTLVTEPITLYAKWTPQVCTVTFDSQGGTAVTAKTCLYGNTITKPTDPYRQGAVFKGWYTKASGGEEFKFGETLVKGNITLYARWDVTTFKVTFNSNGGSAVNPQTIEYGKKATEPTKPTYEGFVFVQWCSDATLRVKYDFNQAVTSNLTLYAKWDVQYCTVTYNSHSESVVPEDVVEYGSTLGTAPLITPEKEHYTFKGWYTAETGGTLFNFATTPIKSDMTLHAQWTADKYTVQFDSKGGSAVASQTIEYNKTATKPADPVLTYNKFTGWYTDEGCTNAFDFTTPIVKNTTLYAGWEEIQAESIVITGATDNQEVNTTSSAPQSITLKAVVSPSGGQEVDWSYWSSTSKITFNTSTQVVSAEKNSSGIIRITASARDGSGVSKTITIRYYDLNLFASGDKYNVTSPSGVSGIGIAHMNDTTTTSMVIPSTIDGKPVVELYYVGETSETITKPTGGLYGCTSLEYLYLPDTIEKIGDGSLSNTRIKNITIPAAVSSIGSRAFCYDEYLEEISVNESNKTYCSYNGSLLSIDKTNVISVPRSSTSIVLPNTLTSVGDHAFYQYKNLGQIATLDLSETSIQTINSYGFAYSGFINITLPSTTTMFMDHAFTGSNALEKVNFDKANYIGDYAFAACGHLGIDKSTLIIPASCAQLGKYAFAYCSNVWHLEVKSNRLIGNKIPEGAFMGFSELQDVTISTNNIKEIGAYAFSDCKTLETVTLPNSIQTIGNYAFYNNINLKTFTFPTSLTSIGDYAFTSTMISTITLPAGLTSIGTSAFANMSNEIVELYIPSTVNAIGLYAFNCKYTTTSVVIVDSQDVLNLETQWITIPPSSTTTTDYSKYILKIKDTLTIPGTSTVIGARTQTGTEEGYLVYTL